ARPTTSIDADADADADADGNGNGNVNADVYADADDDWVARNGEVVEEVRVQIIEPSIQQQHLSQMHQLQMERNAATLPSGLGRGIYDASIGGDVSNDGAGTGRDADWLLDLWRPRVRLGAVSGQAIPISTELEFDSNVQFLDQEDDDDDDTALFMTQPFACGSTFTVSVLDSLMSTTFFNENALTLIRTMVTGGATPELERILAEGSGMRGGGSAGELAKNRGRCHLAQLRLAETPLARVCTDDAPYRRLFVEALKTHGILSIGLYRLLHFAADVATGDGDPGNWAGRQKRFVITNPPGDFPLLASDWLFCLVPFNPAGGTRNLARLGRRN
ncbi:unnamed protein product, partial [Protopolystoma xenopodis]